MTRVVFEQRLTPEELTEARLHVARVGAIRGNVTSGLHFDEAVEYLLQADEFDQKIINKYELDKDENWTWDTADGTIYYEA